MRPITELDPQTAASLRGVCFDVDETVTTDGTLDPEAYAALWALREAGLGLIAATGRPLGWAELFARMWPVDAAVGENGAGWFFNRDGLLVAGYAEDESTRADHCARLQSLRESILAAMPDVRLSDDSWCRRCDLAFDVGERVTLGADRIAELVGRIEGASARSTVSTVHAHAAFGYCDKATGIAGAADQALGIGAEDLRHSWLFVGDSGNDGPAFDWFSATAGVANVRDFLHALPTPPTYVATRRAGAGFAEIANAVLAARGAR